MSRISILGIPIDPVTQEEVLLRIEGFLRSGKQHHIATPNPEMFVEARKNAAFRTVLQRTAMNLPDGIGLVWAMRRRRRGNVTRVTGTDTLLALCSRTTDRIFLLGAAPGVAELASEELRRKNPALTIVGTFAGSPRAEDEADIINRINAASPSLLFVAYGAPKQDLWIARNLSKMPSVRVAMGIGGALDFIAGKRKRAPQWMRHAGFEWAWRLMWEPMRLRRIWNAVVIFPFLTSPFPPPDSHE